MSESVRRGHMMGSGYMMGVNATSELEARLHDDIMPHVPLPSLSMRARLVLS